MAGLPQSSERLRWSWPSAKSRRWRRAVTGCISLALIAAACSDQQPATETGESAESEVAQATPTTSFPEPVLAEGGPGQEFLALDLDDQIADFLAAPNSTKGAVIAENMGETGDPRWGAWLLDMHRLGRSTRIDGAATEAFAKLSGIEEVGQRTDDYRNYGNWVYNEAVDPGPGYREWKLGLYGSIDPEFAELLADTPDDLLLARIQWGGVTRGGIPELNNPERVIASEADWMVAEELILGVVVNGEAVAYPIRILGHHELANDEIAGLPVSMVYCTLCRSGLLFDRRVGDDVLDFQTSGLLIESNKIMVDIQTDTLWRHQTGVGIVGELENAVLEQYPVSTTSWEEWIAEHPDSEVLTIPGPIFDASNPEKPPIAYPYDVGGAYRFYYEDPDVWFPVLDTPDVFQLKEQVIGLTGGDERLAIQIAGILEAGPQVFEVGESTIAVVPTGAGAAAYDVTGSGLSEGPLLEAAESSSTELTLENGSKWERIAASQLFWFAWFGEHPDTAWWPR